MIIKIQSAEWAQIQEIQKRQDYHAFSLGVLEWEFLKHRAALLDIATSGKPDLEKLGALQWERDTKQAFWYEKITQTEDAQRKIGEAALRAAGVDPASGEFTISEGVVLVLNNGAWLPLER